MAVICGVVTASVFQLIISVAFGGYSVYIVSSLAEFSNSFTFIVNPGLWTSVLAFEVTTLFTGIIGCVASCQRGQCVMLTYLVSCILASFSSCEVIVISAIYVMNYCKIVAECTKYASGIFWIIVLACSSFMFFISLIGSGFACRARCHCCASSGDNSNNIHDDPNDMVLSSTTVPPMMT